MAEMFPIKVLPFSFKLHFTFLRSVLNHRRRKVLNTGGGGRAVGRGGGESKVQNIAGGAKLFAGCKLIEAPGPNQCQIITFLTLKIDNIAKLSLELKSILLEIPSNKRKGTYIKLVLL